jgi:succinate dehydrogenase / fumarate reductase cytochrome b subunit
MSGFLNYSSITKKLILSIAGIFLMLFLIVHLGINIFILPITENHQEIFRDAVHFMTSNPVIKVFEIVLFAAFIIHFIYGVIIQVKNWIARPVRYKMRKVNETSYFSKFMIHTGIIIAVFLVIHFINFYFVKLGLTTAPEGPVRVDDNHDFYNMAINLFANNYYAIFYIAIMVFLGFHLNHAFQSAFQTIGVNHPVYTPVIKAVGDFYSIIIPLGFIMIPAYFLIFY